MSNPTSILGTQRNIYLSKSYEAIEVWRFRKDMHIVVRVPETLKATSGLLEVGDVIKSFTRRSMSRTRTGSESSMDDDDDVDDDDMTDLSDDQKTWWTKLFEEATSDDAIEVEVVVEDFPSWREKCINIFNLKHAPDALKDSLAVGTEDAWKRYFHYRILRDFESTKLTEEADACFGGNKELLEDWRYAMKTKIGDLMEEKCEWQWTPYFSDCDMVWEDSDDLRSAEYLGHVWSPFPIPRCIALKHNYHCRVRWSTVDFYVTWEYKLINFECANEEIKRCSYEELCSNSFEDEKLRADVIRTSNLNEHTLGKMRRHLYGSSSDTSKSLTCSDKNLLLLLFGSMGTTDSKLEDDPMRGGLGYVWRPRFGDGEKERKKLFDAKVPLNDDPNSSGSGSGSFPESFDDYFPEGCSWLYHRVLEVSKTLGPCTMHYREPTIRDAPGYESSSEYGECGDGDEYW